MLSGQAMQQLLDGVRALIPLQENAEVTLEANPGTVEAGRFSEYVQAGVNRISIGVQSMQQDKLKALGRIHSQEEAINAAKQAHGVGLRSFNLDLMHGLPGQSIDDALADLTQIIALQPPHISWYQLTIEPNTQFYSKPRPCQRTTPYGKFKKGGKHCWRKRATSSTKFLAMQSRGISANTT